MNDASVWGLVHTPRARSVITTMAFLGCPSPLCFSLPLEYGSLRKKRSCLLRFYTASTSHWPARRSVNICCIIKFSGQKKVQSWKFTRFTKEEESSTFENHIPLFHGHIFLFQKSAVAASYSLCGISGIAVNSLQIKSMRVDQNAPVPL